MRFRQILKKIKDVRGCVSVALAAYYCAIIASFSFLKVAMPIFACNFWVYRASGCFRRSNMKKQTPQLNCNLSFLLQMLQKKEDMGKFMKAASFSLASAKYSAGDNLKCVLFAAARSCFCSPFHCLLPKSLH